MNPIDANCYRCTSDKFIVLLYPIRASVNQYLMPVKSVISTVIIGLPHPIYCGDLT